MNTTRTEPGPDRGPSRTRPRRRRGAHILALAGLLATALAVRPAVAQCIDPFEDGQWANDDPNTGGVTRVDVTMICNDVILCGVDENGNVNCQPPGPPWRIHLWGRCHPSDCDWGAVDGQDFFASDGTKWISGYYDQGFAKRYVYVKPSSLRPGHLFLWMFTDFADPGRADYVLRNWFHQ